MTAGTYRVTMRICESFTVDVEAESEPHAISDARTAFKIFGERVFKLTNGAICSATAELLKPEGGR